MIRCRGRMLAIAFLVLFMGSFAIPADACLFRRDHSGHAKLQANAFERGQPLRNIIRFVGGGNRRARRGC